MEVVLELTPKEEDEINDLFRFCGANRCNIGSTYEQNLADQIRRFILRAYDRQCHCKKFLKFCAKSSLAREKIEKGESEFSDEEIEKAEFGGCSDEGENI